MDNIDKAIEYISGLNRRKIDCKKAIELLDKELGNPIALCWKKSLQPETKFTEEDFKKLLLYDTDKRAQNCIGYCYLHGIGVQEDYKQAIRWYTLSAEQGQADGQANLACCFYDGIGVEKNLEKAIHWYTLSARQGNVNAQFNLGQCYECGHGVKKDHEKAFHFYTLSAEQGMDVAQCSLAYYHREGLGVKKDLERSVHWYTLSAQQGNVNAQHNLGNCYLNGIGIKQDLEKAIHFYTLSAKQGCASAQNELDRLQNPIRIENIFSFPNEHTPEMKAPDPTCSICAVNIRTVVCLPCRHMTMCFNCAKLCFEQKQECPLCRSKVKSVIKVYT